MAFMEIGDKRIHYSDHGPTGKNGEATATVIFTHGLGATQDYFVPMLPLLRGNGFRCIVYDGTGAGHRSAPAVQQTIQTLSDDAFGIHDKMAGDNAVRVRRKIGTLLAANLAAMKKHPVVASIWLEPLNDELREEMQSRAVDAGKGGTSQVAATAAAATIASRTGVCSRADRLAKPVMTGMILAHEFDHFLADCRVDAEAEPLSLREVKTPLMVAMRASEDGLALSEGPAKIFEAIVRLPIDRITGTLFTKSGDGGLCSEPPDLVAKQIMGFLKKQLQ